MDAIGNFIGTGASYVVGVVVAVFLLAVLYRMLQQKWPGFIQRWLDK